MDLQKLKSDEENIGDGEAVMLQDMTEKEYEDYNYEKTWGGVIKKINESIK